VPCSENKKPVGKIAGGGSHRAVNPLVRGWFSPRFENGRRVVFRTEKKSGAILSKLRRSFGKRRRF